MRRGERERAAYGRSLALAWVRNHLSEVPRLAAVKAVYSWKGYGGPPEWLLLLLSLGGYLVWVRRPEARVLLALLAIHTSAIAATYWTGISLSCLSARSSPLALRCAWLEGLRLGTLSVFG